MDHERRKTTCQSRIPTIVDLRDRNRSFDGLAAYNVTEVALDTGNDPVRVRGLSKRAGTTSTCWEFSRILAASFTPRMSMAPNSAPYIVLTYGILAEPFSG